MKSRLLSPKMSLRFRLAAASLLPLLATATVARADGDLIDYRDTVRHYDELTQSSGRGSSASARPVAGAHVAYLHVARRPAAAARVTVTGDLPKSPSAATDGYFISYPGAEATGAAQGQTVNRATNDLN